MNEIPGPRAASKASEHYSGVLGEARALLGEFTGILQDQVHLAVLEAKQAGVNLAFIIALGIIMAILILSAWLGLMGVLVLLLVEKQIMAASAALGVAVGANVLIALILGFMVYRRSHGLSFDATARSLRALFSKDPYGEAS
jgi:uncharacterized membrane protein YqjE